MYLFHLSGRILYWFQTKEDFNDVSFCFMWAIAIFILWTIFDDPWIAVIPPAFIAFGDGITGIVRNFAFKQRRKHPIGNIYMSGVCIPIGWIIQDDSIECYGVYNNVIHYDESLCKAQNSVSPAPAGYYWWVGKGEVVSTIGGNVYAVLSIQTDNQIGMFSVDYMLGDSYNGVNQQRSDDHQIEIIDDEYSPRRLRASIEGSSALLNWVQPRNISGLVGYNIYRDEEKINYLERAVLTTSIAFLSLFLTL